MNNLEMVFYCVLLLFSLICIFIFVKGKKYWYIPYGVLMATTFAGFIYNEFHASSFGYYSLVLLVGISVIESGIDFVKVLKGSVESQQSGLIRKNKLVWGFLSIGIKISMVYLIFFNYL